MDNQRVENNAEVSIENPIENDIAVVANNTKDTNEVLLVLPWYHLEYPFCININWTIAYYVTTRGAESFHLYLWILKDFFWSQGFYYPSIIFGSAALAWCLGNLL